MNSRDINTKPTQEMANEAEQALEWRAEFGRGGTDVGVARARDLKNRVNLSIDTIKRMFSYFSRHEVDKEAEGFRPGEDGYPSAGRIAWGLWGGDPGFSWTKRKIKEIENEENSINIKDMENKKSKRHIEKIEETDESIIIHFAKAHAEEMNDVISTEEEVEEVVEEEVEDSPNVELYQRSISNKETRYLNIQDLEVRAEGEETIVEGYASIFDSESNDLGGFVEYIGRNAFDGRTDDDVRFLLNHDPNYIYGRTTANTISLSRDERGLRYSVNLPNTQAGRDLAVSLGRGDITQSSFAFRIEDDSWEEKEGKVVRTINKVSQLFDVSAVVYPAYDEATVGLRSMEEWKEKRTKEKLEENLEKELLENKKEELDLHKRNLAELRLKIKINN